MFCSLVNRSQVSQILNKTGMKFCILNNISTWEVNRTAKNYSNALPKVIGKTADSINLFPQDCQTIYMNLYRYIANRPLKLEFIYNEYFYIIYISTGLCESKNTLSPLLYKSYSRHSMLKQ